MNHKKNTLVLYRIGYYTILYGTALILFWIGVFKFTQAEANAIKPLLTHHFLFSWLYHLFSVQGVSNLIGIVEIIVGFSFILGTRFVCFRKIAFIGSTIIFCVTLSFLFTTPGKWRIIEGVPITDFFILKDIALLATGFISLRKP